jgi:hypothetical protein
VRHATVWLALACAMAAAVPASAHPESAAAALRPDVVAAWHEPADLEPHTQWEGFLQLSSESNVTAASYQICRVGQTCFAPPTPAERLANGTWRFDTADYTVNGSPVDYEPGWRLGVKWWLTEAGNRTVEFPSGPELASVACSGDAALPCAEAHYLAFDLPAAAKGAPGLPPLLFLAALALAAALRPAA